ncbi:hypothetical protein VPH35_105001 [Triticum aestivum]
METLQPIQQTLGEIALGEIDKQIPGALRTAFGLENFFALYLEPPHPRERRERDGDEPRALRMIWASCYAPRHNEDAHFGHNEAGIVGVADGAAGTATKSAFLQVLATEPGPPVCPYTLLEQAYKETVASAADGGSTAVILSLAGTALKWAFIGDSAFSRQQRRFNYPFQLNATGKGERVNKADVRKMAVRHGDVVVLGTDGLFDNMFDAELEVVVRMGMALGLSPKNMADVVAGIAYEMSTSKTKDSPYNADSRRIIDHRRGGKPYDITVVVAFIVSLYS